MRRCSKPADPLRWSADIGWEGITDADRAEWSQAYPAADLTVELAKATQWLKANPKKARKSNWRRWLTTVWLSKCQDRGGTHREPGRRPDGDDAARRAQLDRKAREFAGMKPAPYRRPAEVVALADTLRLKEEDL
jgi:hypothetical protein